MAYKTDQYDQAFIAKNQMGPNAMLMLEELTEKAPLKPGMRVLDLGCGNGLTSIFLAKEFGVQVFAVDLWVTATDNHQRFIEMGLDDRIIPLRADALNLPFAENYFDAIISVDAYQYFGNNDHYFKEKLKPLLKKDAWIGLAFPGMKYEVQDNIPEDMKPYWDQEILEMCHSIPWWKTILEQELSNFSIEEMACFERAWNDWLATDNPYAVEDRDMMRMDAGRFMNLIKVTGNVK